jgi:predicted negative regulator of RcsB-dependent stress response
MRTIQVTTRYGANETTIRLRDGKTATRRQYDAAMARLRAIKGDYLKMVNHDQPDIVVYNGDREWAVIA